jgi:hypothetical protein
MTSSKPLGFNFYPRPEAHAMDWDNLLPPLRLAVRDLLARIKGAAKKMDMDEELIKSELSAEEQLTANCFLVHGDRGTGKTTVLLSAKRAVTNEYKNKFWGSLEGSDPELDSKLEAYDYTKELNVYWLDILDLEPLPPGTNLLTTMLTRVRNALDKAGHDENLPESALLLEEGTTGARHKLKHLINDAALVWENIHEQDTRSRANRQVAAADIYAQYREQFKKAMAALSEELGRRNGSRGKFHPIVLPIDNIDRSTEHLYQVVKLAQMVACPHLWLVMAGDRQDVDTFLERAFWKELIRIGEADTQAVGTGTGKKDVRGQDEALVMARRQAAAASHKLLPPSHRIKIDLLKPKEVLDFRLDPEKSEKSLSILELLQKVRITPEEALNSRRWPEINMLHLLQPRVFIEDIMEDIPKEENSCFMGAAEFGLRLPARGVLDLWQLAYWVTFDSTFSTYPKRERRAEKIARTMLQNVLKESETPNDVGRDILEKIIRRNSSGDTMLDYWSSRDSRRDLPDRDPLKVNPLSTLYFDLQLPPNRKQVVDLTVRSRIIVNEFKASFIKFWDDPLPDLVATWLTILHDSLVWGGEKAVVINSPHICPPAIVTCMHEIVYFNKEKKIHEAAKTEWRQPTEWMVLPWQWTVPRWHSFFANNIFGQLWCYYLSVLDHANENTHDRTKPLDLANSENSLPRLLATGWIACVLETFLIFAYMKPFINNTGLRFPESIYKKLKKKVEGLEHGNVKQAIKEIEIDVMHTAEIIYEHLSRQTPSEIVYQTVYESDEVTWPMKDWLEFHLPLLLSQWLVPTSESYTEIRIEEIRHFLKRDDKETELALFWKNNASFLLADIEQKWEELLPSEAGFIPIGPFEELLGEWVEAHVS